MYGRQYPIFNKINSCAYSNQNKSYGIREHGELECFIGKGSKRSTLFFTTKTTHRETSEGLHEYRLYIDGELIKKAIYDYKLDEFEIEKFN